jgi:hypothetical protein
MEKCLAVGLVLVGFLLPGGVLAEEKWGKVSKAVLEMEVLPEDPEAEAVILFDTSEMTITPQFRLSIKRHRRVKILTDRGLDQANVSIVYNKDDRIRSLKAHTILPDGKKVRLPKKAIFEERHRGMMRKVFALPAVGPGVVIEYSYEQQSKNLHFLQPWFFQNRVFTKLSRLALNLPDGFNFQAFYSNFPHENPKPGTEDISYLEPGVGTVKVTKFVWQEEDLPAARTEPHMTIVRDYLTQVRFQLASYKGRGRTYNFLRGWDDIAKMVRGSYDPFLKPGGQTGRLVHSLLPEGGDDLAKARALYEHVQTAIQTGPSKWVLGRDLRSPGQVLRDKAGSAVEKNLLLLNLLRNAGLSAYPCLISTRSNGRLDEGLPMIQQFDFAMACLELGTDTVMLDARDAKHPFGLLPSEDLNGKGMVIDENGYRMVDIVPPTSYKHAMTEAELEGNGDLVCQTTLGFQKHDAVQRRAELAKTTEEKFVRELLGEHFNDVTLDSFAVGNATVPGEPLSVRMTYRVQGYGQVMGEMMYIEPGFFHAMRSNPFQRQDRDFPVDFAFGRISMEEVLVRLPEGFRILEAPRPTIARLGGIKFVAACQLKDGALQYQRRYQRKAVRFAVSQYAELREVFGRIISSDKGQVVLTSRPVAPPTDG